MCHTAYGKRRSNPAALYEPAVVTPIPSHGSEPVLSRSKEPALRLPKGRSRDSFAPKGHLKQKDLSLAPRRQARQEEMDNAIDSKSHKKQILTYLRLAHRKLGFLLNFGAAVMKDGITRTVNGLDAGR